MADRPRRNSKKPDRLSNRQNDEEYFRRQTELAKHESLKQPRPSASAAPKPAGTIKKIKKKIKKQKKLNFSTTTVLGAFRGLNQFKSMIVQSTLMTNKKKSMNSVGTFFFFLLLKFLVR